MPDFEAQHVRKVSMTPQQVRAQVNDVVSAMSQMRVITDAELQNIRRIFEEHDQDGSDSIDMVELRHVMECLGSAPSESQLIELVQQVTVVDVGDGGLSFPEFLQLILLYKEAVQYSFLETESGAPTRSQLSIAAANSMRLPLPDSTERVVADVLIALGSLYVISSALIATVRPDPGLDWSVFLDLCVASLVNVFDILISAFTCLFNPTTGEVHDSPVLSFKRYARGFLALDLCAAMPWELWPNLRWLRAIKTIKIVKILQTRPPSGRVRMDESYVWLHYTVIYQFRLLYLFALLVHTAACIFIWLQQGKGRGSYGYDQALYWVVYTVSTVGYGDVAIDTTEQRVFAVGLFIVSLLMNGFVIAEIGAFLNRTDVEEEQRGKMRETVAALRAFNVPRALRAEILSFQWHQLRSNISTQNAELLQGLPEQMQDGLGLFVRMRIIQCVPLFRAAHPGCRIALAQSLTSVVAAPEEYIIVLGEVGNEMYFLGHGYVEVLRSDGHVLATLSHGAFFGEIALLTNLTGRTGGLRTASIKALSYCDLFRLDRQDFFHILQRFPRFRESIKLEMRRTERRVSRFEALRARSESAATGALQESGMLMESEQLLSPSGTTKPDQDLQDYRMPLDEGLLSPARNPLAHAQDLPPAANQPPANPPQSVTFVGAHPPARAVGNVSPGADSNGRIGTPPTAALPTLGSDKGEVPPPLTHSSPKGPKPRTSSEGPRFVLPGLLGTPDMPNRQTSDGIDNAISSIVRGQHGAGAMVMAGGRNRVFDQDGPGSPGKIPRMRLGQLGNHDSLGIGSPRALPAWRRQKLSPSFDRSDSQPAAVPSKRDSVTSVAEQAVVEALESTYRRGFGEPRSPTGSEAFFSTVRYGRKDIMRNKLHLVGGQAESRREEKRSSDADSILNYTQRGLGSIGTTNIPVEAMLQQLDQRFRPLTEKVDQINTRLARLERVVVGHSASTSSKAETPRQLGSPPTPPPKDGVVTPQATPQGKTDTHAGHLPPLVRKNQSPASEPSPQPHQ
eukprot:TRINITY_DN1563_c0_g1_i1.p1 TRINITY_DN1563_c0_g1~~TRINITY_DN1563_c0_g1_i1.p1  ORF type:complete len:1018 (+),score=195.57 TRINITY_DN1563_c0_g1_i1:111-3164(+)